MEELKQSFGWVYDSSTSSKLQEMARKNLGETEDLKKERLQQLRNLIKDHKVACISTDDFLLRFLRMRKFNLKRSFETLRNYAHQRTILHKKLLKLPADVLDRCLRLNVIGVLPFLDDEERIIYFYRPDIWNPDVCSFDELSTVAFLLTNFVSENKSSQISGMFYLLASESVPLSYAFHIIPCMNRMRNFLFNSVPVRYSRVNIVTDSAIFKYFFALMSPIIPKKLAQRMVLHQEFGEALFEQLPRTILPEEFGGTLGPLNPHHLIEIMMDYFQKVKDEHHYFEQHS